MGRQLRLVPAVIVTRRVVFFDVNWRPPVRWAIAGLIALDARYGRGRATASVGLMLAATTGRIVDEGIEASGTGRHGHRRWQLQLLLMR